METLGKLFGGTGQVKIMRLFLLNPEAPFTTKEVAYRSKVTISLARKEINGLIGAKFLKKKSGAKSVTFILNPTFPYLVQMRSLLIDANILKGDEIARRFKNAGRIKLLVISGIFIKDPESRVDILIVGENLIKSKIDNAVRLLESEIGKELSYATFETPDFLYRLSMYDKLVCDILDFPHERVIEGIKLSTYALKKS